MSELRIVLALHHHLVREGLRLLLADYEEHAGLTGEGNYMQRTFLRGALVGRLLTVNALTRFPSFVDVPIERPIFVTGIPRSGTTALHRLLCADPASQGLELWLTEYPQPRPPRHTWESDPIFAGISAAGACWVAQQIARQVEKATIVFVVCDRGDRYLSTGVFPA